MAKSDVIRLVKTLSATEKRFFKLYCKKQTGDRAYLTLFDIIDHTEFKNIEQLEHKLQLMHPEAAFEPTANYLLKTLTNSLVYSKCEKDALFQQMQSFLRAKVLFSRSLVNEGLKELNKVQKSARTSQNHLMEYMSCREELDVLSGLNFSDVNEDQVVEMQAKGKRLLKSLLQVHEHHSLFELLKTRLTYIGRSMSEQAQQKFNDLLLSELSLVTSKVAYNFQSTKLHLMFQSFFFTTVGDYRSALKTFSELDALFQANKDKSEQLPLDYLSTLEGILDSLRTIRAFDEMPVYIAKVNSLIDTKYPEHFNQQATKTVVTFQLSAYVGCSKYPEALEYAAKQDQMLLRETIITDYEKHCELLFYLGLVHFSVHEWEKALKFINKITMFGKANHNFTIYKAAKLLGILIRYELGDLEYIQYEIRAYKRLAQHKGEVLKIEKILFKATMLHPNNNSVVKNKLLLKKMEATIRHIANDRYELQLLKFYDFLTWIENKFSGSQAKQTIRKATTVALKK